MPSSWARRSPPSSPTPTIAGPQSLKPGPHPGGLQQRIGGRRGLPYLPGDPGVPDRGVNLPAGFLQRSGRPQAHLRADQPVWRDPGELVPGYRRHHRSHRRGRRHHAGCHGRARSQRPQFVHRSPCRTTVRRWTAWRAPPRIGLVRQHFLERCDEETKKHTEERPAGSPAPGPSWRRCPYRPALPAAMPPTGPS